MIVSNLALRATAYHEAGHTVAAYQMRVAVYVVSIAPDDFTSGHVKNQRLLNLTMQWDRSDRNRMHMERQVIIALAGMEAQRQFNPRTVRHYHAQQDYENAIDALTHFSTSDEEVQAYINYLLARTRSLLALPAAWEQVEALAKALMERRKIIGKEVVHIISAALEL